VKIYAVDVNTSRTTEEGAHSPSWPHGLINIVITIIVSIKGFQRSG
jgi:capsular polysaccharide biosynthesis protein